MYKKIVSKIEKWSGLVGLIISLIALIATLQNTDATRQLVSSNIVFLNSDDFKKETAHGAFENIDTLGCTYVLRLANLGGASASIVSGEATVLYQNTTYTAPLENESVNGMAYGYPTYPLDAIGFAVLPVDNAPLSIDEGWTGNFILDAWKLPFPLQIAPFGTLDIKAQIVLMFRSLEGKTNGKELLALAKNVPVEFKFKTASGQSVSVQGETCG